MVFISQSSSSPPPGSFSEADLLYGDTYFCFFHCFFATSVCNVPEVNELILKQKQMSEEKRLKLDHPVSTAHLLSPSPPKVWVLRLSQFLKWQLWCPEWVQVADIPGCLESWPGEPGLGKRQPDAGAPDPEEEAVGGGKESSFANSLPDNSILMVLMNLLASELTRKILQHFSTFSWCIISALQQTLWIVSIFHGQRLLLLDMVPLVCWCASWHSLETPFYLFYTLLYVWPIFTSPSHKTFTLVSAPVKGHVWKRRQRCLETETGGRYGPRDGHVEVLWEDQDGKHQRNSTPQVGLEVETV